MSHSRNISIWNINYRNWSQFKSVSTTCTSDIFGLHHASLTFWFCQSFHLVPHCLLLRDYCIMSITRLFFYNCHRIKSSLLSLYLSFCITAVILADNSILHDDSILRGSIIKITLLCIEKIRLMLHFLPIHSYVGQHSNSCFCNVYGQNCLVLWYKRGMKTKKYDQKV